MDKPKIIDGLLHAPFFIYVKCRQQLSDKELLKRLNLSSYKDKYLPGYKKKRLYITHDKNWSHIADDWCYNLWHSQSIRGSISELSKEFNVFTCSVGDCDHSYDFSYYENGEIKRNYVVDHPEINNPKVTIDEGHPLSGEVKAFKKKDEFKIILTLAKSLGINTDYKRLNIKTYYSK